METERGKQSAGIDATGIVAPADRGAPVARKAAANPRKTFPRTAIVARLLFAPLRRLPRLAALGGPPLLCLALALAVLRVSATRGLIFPARIASGSMAPTLYGPCFAVPCSACGFVFRVDAARAPRDKSLICPNCGRGGQQALPSHFRPGQRVLIDRAGLWPAPRRWSLVAYRAAEAGGPCEVKRLIGLPGEEIALREGDALVNGRPPRRSFAELRATMPLAHDDRFRAAEAPGCPPRWREHPAPGRSASEDSPRSGWIATPEGHAFAPDAASAPGGEPSWRELRYEHRRASPGHADAATAPAPLWDEYGYNQPETRVLHACRESLFECEIRVGPATRARLLAHTGAASGVCELDFGSGVWRAWQAERTLGAGRLPAAAGWRALRAAVADGALRVELDGLELVDAPLDLAPRGAAPSSTPWGVAAADGPLSLRGPRVGRDVYHLHPAGVARPWRSDRPLAPDEVFVLGDNAPASVDSRRRQARPLRLRQLLGVVIPLE